MRNLMKILTIFLMASAVISPMAFAESASSAAYPVTATVDSSLTLNVVLRKNSSTGAIVNSMDFGKLMELNPSTGSLRSSSTSTTGTGNITAMISAISHGASYMITQNGSSGMSNGSATLPAGACTVVPVYSPEDNKGNPLVGRLIGPGSWVASRILYFSDASGTPRIIQAVYSITDDPEAGATAGVPLSQAGGNYSGTVTFTVTT